MRGALGTKSAGDEAQGAGASGARASRGFSAMSSSDGSSASAAPSVSQGGFNVVINVNGGVSDQNMVQKLVNEIEGVMARQNKLSKYGAI